MEWEETYFSMKETELISKSQARMNRMISVTWKRNAKKINEWDRHRALFRYFSS